MSAVENEERHLLSDSGSRGDSNDEEASLRASGSSESSLLSFRRRRRASSSVCGSSLSLLGLAAVVYYEVSGGPFGSEDAVSSGGPLLALAGFIVMPLVWSVPEAFVVAELATAMPENAGYAAWVAEAFGPFWGFQEGFWSWVSGVTDNAVYPVLFLYYLCGDCDVDRSTKEASSVNSDTINRGQLIGLDALTWPNNLHEDNNTVELLLHNPLIKWIFLVITIALLTLINYRGIHIVGRTSVVLAAFTLLPFIFMILLGIPKVVPSRWLDGPTFGKPLNIRQLTDGSVRWRPLLNVLFWNLNYFDSASTIAGEVSNPQSTFPRAMFIAVIIVVLNYILPLAIGIGVTSSIASWAQWNDGSLSEVAKLLGGRFLHFWVVVAAGVSNVGLFLAEMSSDSYQLAGMAERGMIPAIFNMRSRYGTPTIGILLSAVGVIIIGLTPLDKVVEMLNFLYCFAALLEFAAFIKLRISHPSMPRPYRVPLNTTGAISMLLVPSVFIIIVLLLSSMMTLIFCSSIIFIGLFLPSLIHQAKKNRWCQFIELPSSSVNVYRSTSHNEDDSNDDDDDSTPIVNSSVISADNEKYNQVQNYDRAHSK